MALPTVDTSKCTGCGTCSDECPSGCWDIDAHAVLARPDDCAECGICSDACPNGAISLD